MVIYMLFYNLDMLAGQMRIFLKFKISRHNMQFPVLENIFFWVLQKILHQIHVLDLLFDHFFRAQIREMVDYSSGA